MKELILTLACVIFFMDYHQQGGIIGGFGYIIQGSYGSLKLFQSNMERYFPLLWTFFQGYSIWIAILWFFHFSVSSYFWLWISPYILIDRLFFWVLGSEQCFSFYWCDLIAIFFLFGIHPS